MSATIANANDIKSKDSTLNRAPIVLAGVASMENFKENFEARGETLSYELVGFNSIKVEDEAETSVYSIPANSKLINSNYDCHFHYDESGNTENAHCHEIGDSEPRDYVAASGSFSTIEFVEAAENAVGLFERVFGDPKKIKEAKLWRSSLDGEDNIQVQFVWVKGDGTDATNHMYCHKHQHNNEVEIDCHRQKKAGPNQP